MLLIIATTLVCIAFILWNEKVTEKNRSSEKNKYEATSTQPALEASSLSTSDHASASNKDAVPALPTAAASVASTNAAIVVSTEAVVAALLSTEAAEITVAAAADASVEPSEVPVINKAVAPIDSKTASAAEELDDAPVQSAMNFGHLSCAPFPDEDVQKHVFGFVGEKHWLIMGAVSRQWQQTYKQYIELRRVQTLPGQQRRHGTPEPPCAEYNETDASVVFETMSLFLMAIWGGTLDLHDSQAQYNVGRYCCWNLLSAAERRGMPWSDDVLRGIAMSGNLRNMQWARRKHTERWSAYLADCMRPWPADIADFAAASGNVNMVRLLHEQKAKFTAETSVRAVKPGRLHMVQYLHGQGCPVNLQTTIAAAECGALDIVQFLHSSDCVFSMEHALSEATNSGHLHVVKWLVQHGAELSNSTLEAAASCGHSELCQYLMERGCVWTAEITDIAVKRSPELIPWMLSQGIALTAEQRASYVQR
jgi:Ankyrin repeats (3 copies)